MKKDLLDWFFKKNRGFTLEEVQQLIEQVKVFNAGAIDEYLSKHVDQVFEKWLEERRGK